MSFEELKPFAALVTAVAFFIVLALWLRRASHRRYTAELDGHVVTLVNRHDGEQLLIDGKLVDEKRAGFLDDVKRGTQGVVLTAKLVDSTGVERTLLAGLQARDGVSVEASLWIDGVQVAMKRER